MLKNMRHEHENDLMPKNKIGTQINQLDLDGNFIKTCKSIKDVIDNYKTSSKSLNKAIKNNIELKGFKWES